MYKPMLASPLEIGLEKHQKKWERVHIEGYIMEPKLDGMRLILEFDSAGKLFHAWTRSGRDVLPQVPEHWVAFLPILPNTVLDCEFGYISFLWNYPLIDFNRTMRVMGSNPAEAQRKAREYYWHAKPNEYQVGAIVFDILQYNNLKDVQDYSWTDRRELLIEATQKGYNGGGSGLFTMPNWGAWSEAIYEDYVSRGGEGVMLKHPDHPYRQGKRPAASWFKVKKFDTVDVTIIDSEPGQGKYSGLIGALVFEDAEGNQGRCSGMTDTDRIDMTLHWDDFVGRTMEIRFFGLTAGTMRHPQFIRMRDDL